MGPLQEEEEEEGGGFMRLSRRCLYGVTRYVGEKRSSGHKSLYRNFEFSVPIVYDRSRPIESKRGTDRLTAFNPSTLVDGPFPFMDQGRGGGREGIKYSSFPKLFDRCFVPPLPSAPLSLLEIDMTLISIPGVRSVCPVDFNVSRSSIIRGAVL